ncbi:MAG TPA: hypothetical protein VM100_09850 [Longimicrobiales bacterium]|nr:hypothetical protein [Longimicrobiales bacterium]
MIDKAKEALSTVSDRAGEQIETRLSDQKSRAAEKLTGVSDALRTSSQQISQNGQDDIGQYMERAAQQVDRVANYLPSSDVRQMAREVETFARRNPAAFVAGAFVVGFAASRFLKASGGHSYMEGGLADGRSSGLAMDNVAPEGFDSPRASVGLEDDLNRGI